MLMPFFLRPRNPQPPRKGKYRHGPRSVAVPRWGTGLRHAVSFCKEKGARRPAGHLRVEVRSLLPVVPAASFRGADEKAEYPEDEPDDEQNPEDLKRWCKQAAPTEEQQQQD